VETQAITRRLESVRSEPISEVFAWFAQTILPFYRSAASRYLTRLRNEGVFKAFEAVCDPGQRVLVIAISDGRKNLDALYQGVRHASALNNRVIVALVHVGRNASSEWTRDSDPIGTRTILCSLGELWHDVNAEILDISRSRPRKPATGFPEW